MNFTALRLLAPVMLLVQLCTSENRYCQEAVDSVTVVESCPTSKQEWDAAARRKNCNKIASTQKCSHVDQFLYHCVINGYRNVTLEVCAPSRIVFGHCVEFNVGGGVIQDQRSAKCNDTFPKCDIIYNSVDAYKYPDCYKIVTLSETIYSTTARGTNTIATAATASTTQTTSEKIGIIAAIVSVTLILLIAAIVFVGRRRCKVKRPSDPDDCTEGEDMLQKGCKTEMLTSANHLNDTQEEQNKYQIPATYIQTKDSPGCKRTRTYSS